MTVGERLRNHPGKVRKGPMLATVYPTLADLPAPMRDVLDWLAEYGAAEAVTRRRRARRCLS